MSTEGQTIKLPKYVIDASALLAMLQSEPGGEKIEPLLNSSVISSVNWSEVVQKTLAKGISIDGLWLDLEVLGLQLEPFSFEDAEEAAKLWQVTKAMGLSLGDRACLTLAKRLDAEVWTADRKWKTLSLGISVVSIR
jgi:ribonuclease VapC